MKKRAVLIAFLLICSLFLIHKQAVEGQKSDVRNSFPNELKPVAGEAVAFGSSQTVSLLAPAHLSVENSKSKSRFGVRENQNGPARIEYLKNGAHDADGALALLSAVPMPSASLSFDGLSNFDNIAAYGAVIIPPDMIGDVGPDHYVQAVNALVRIFDKNGTPLTPPFKMSQLFAPLGTPCSIRDDGDPIVLYDPLAGRWLLSQYCTNFPPFRQMIAISKTSDPTGEYFLYEFVMPNVRLNDFPKFGVWPDGYYISTDEFVGSDFAGSGMFAFDRNKMLAGDPHAGYIYFNTPSASTARLGGLLPSDLDGLTPPPAGAPNIFVGYTATEYGNAQDAIRLFNFHADFGAPANSIFTERPESPIAVAAFDPTSPNGRDDISQPAPGEMLDSGSDRVNYRAAYRNFGTSESIVFNQTVRTSPGVPYRAGVRLYELKRTGSTGYVPNEQSTIGESSSSRWIGAAAQDHQGNLAVEYNFVNDGKQPSILYTGRLANDPAGTFRDEGTLVNGTGVQKAFGWRWGDYSGMSVDPVDDCTFWMTGEYYTLASEQHSDFTWMTRVGRFKFPECTAAPRSVMTGTVTNASNGQPIVGAIVAAASYTRRTAASGSYGNLAVLPASYSVIAAAAGFRSQIVSVTVANGQTLTQNFSLQPVAVIDNPGTSVIAESCGTNGVPEPGETVTIAVTLRNTGAANTQNLVAALTAGGGVTSPGPAQSYGALAVNGASLTRPFTFTVSPGFTCGGQIAMTLQLQDGAEDLGAVVINLQTGTPKVAFQQNFDRTQLSRLPPRWSRATVAGVAAWSTSQARSQSGTKSAFSPDPIQVGLNELNSPVFPVSTPNARLTFRNWYEFETTFLRNRLYDGSVLEIRIGDGDWQDILAAGGIFESGGYDGLLDACCQNPLAGHPGWSGRSGLNPTSEFITTAAKLPPAAAGQKVQLRWRVGTDIGGFREGQYIDDILVTDGYTCGCP